MNNPDKTASLIFMIIDLIVKSKARTQSVVINHHNITTSKAPAHPNSYIFTSTKKNHPNLHYVCPRLHPTNLIRPPPPPSPVLHRPGPGQIPVHARTFQGLPLRRRQHPGPPLYRLV